MTTRTTGSFIRQARRQLGLTQEALSEGICAPSTLSRIENDEQQAGRRVWKALMERIGQETESLTWQDGVSPVYSPWETAFWEALENGQTDGALRCLLRLQKEGTADAAFRAGSMLIWEGVSFQEQLLSEEKRKGIQGRKEAHSGTDWENWCRQTLGLLERNLLPEPDTADVKVPSSDLRLGGERSLPRNRTHKPDKGLSPSLGRPKSEEKADPAVRFAAAKPAATGRIQRLMWNAAAFCLVQTGRGREAALLLARLLDGLRRESLRPDFDDPDPFLPESAGYRRAKAMLFSNLALICSLLFRHAEAVSFSDRAKRLLGDSDPLFLHRRIRNIRARVSKEGLQRHEREDSLSILAGLWLWVD